MLILPQTYVKLYSMVLDILKIAIARTFLKQWAKWRRSIRLTRINCSDPIYFSNKDFIDERKRQIWH